MDFVFILVIRNDNSSVTFQFSFVFIQFAFLFLDITKLYPSATACPFHRMQYTPFMVFP